jgi:hypothetical protein
MRLIKYFLILAVLIFPIVGSAQYFKLAVDPGGTDIFSTVSIPNSANPLMSDGSNLLVTGDSIGVFNSSGVCYGSGKWVAGNGVGFIMYGISSTPAPNSGGFADNEVYYLKIKHGGVVYSNISSVYSEYFIQSGEQVACITDGKFHSGLNFYFISSIGIQKMVSVNAYIHGVYNATTGVHAPIAVSLELRRNDGTSTTLPTSTLVSRKAGIMSPSGNITIDFGDVIDGNYWVVLRTTGYLALGTTTKISLSASATATYDFTDLSSKAAGTANAMTQPVVPGPWYARAGDLNGDCASAATTDYSAIFKKDTYKNVSSSYPTLTSITTDKLTSPSKNVAVTLKLHGLAGTTTHKQAAATIELRSGTLKGTLVSVRPGLVDASGVLTVDFGGIPNGSYFLCVRAPGYLPFGSTSAITLSSAASATYDFTSSSASAAGTANDLIQPVVPGPWYVRAGDYNFDGASAATTDYSAIFKKDTYKNISSSVPGL